MARFIATVEFMIDDNELPTRTPSAANHQEVTNQLEDVLCFIDHSGVDWRIVYVADVTNAWVESDEDELDDPAVADSPGKDQGSV